MATAAGTPKATRHATAYNAAWVDSMVQLAAACDIDAECRRAEAGGPGASVAAGPPAVTKLVGEVSSCLSLLLGRGPPGTILPDTTLMQTIGALANRAPYLFRLPTLTAGLLAFMGSDRAAAASSASASSGVLPTTVLKRKSPQLAVLAVTILDAAYRTLPADHPWPLSFVRVLLEDYFDLRNWVENDAAAGFLRTITRAFRDWTPPDTAREKNDREESDGEEEITVEESGDTVMVDAPPVASASTASSAGAAANSSSAASAASGVGPSPRAALSVPSSMPMIPLGAIGRGSSLGASTGGLMRNTSSAVGSKDAKQQPLIPRYQQQSLADEIRLMVERAFATAIKGIFPPGARTGTNQIPPHFLRFLSISLGYRSMRHFTLLNIDAWLSHSMSNRAAKRLLVIVAEELHKAAILPSNAASFETVNVLTIPTKTPWADLGANMATFSPETLHAWSRASSPQAVPIDLQSLRLFFQLGLKVKSNMSAAGGGGGLAASNAFWDSAYFQGLLRLFRGATSDHGSSAAPPIASSTPLLLEPPNPSPLLPVVVWKAAFHSWIAQDWQTAASAAGWQQGVSQQASSHHSAPSGPSIPPTPPLLYAPTHFILKCVDLFLMNPPPGGLIPALSSYILSILDRVDYMHRIQFVLRRAMWMNTMAAYSNSNAVAPTPTSGAAMSAAASSSAGAVSMSHSIPSRNSIGFQSTGVAPTIYLDLFSLSKRLLDYTLYAAVPHCVLRPTKEPRLTDEQGRPVAASEAPAAILQQHQAEVVRYHARRETIVTEMVNLVTWCCIVTSQPVVLLQNLAAPASHQGNGSSGKQPHPAHHHPTATASLATIGELSSSLLPSQRLAAAESSLQTWRFSVASIQAKALAWIQNWLLGFLETQPAVTSSSSAAGAAGVETPLPPAIKDATLLFSDALTSLLFLHSSVHQFLQPFLGSSSAPLSLISMPTSRSLVSSSSAGGGLGSGFFLSDVWPLDQSFLKKAAAGLLLDKLPLLEDTIARLVMISLSNPAKLPHAHTIQILELLLRRVCQLALAVGKKYETSEPDSTRANHHNSSSSHHQPPEPSDDDPPPRGILRIQNDGLLESILQLSQFPTPIPPPAPPGQTHPPLLAQSALFWRSCVLLVILSAFNPHTIGRRSWEQVPTLRCLLEMVVSEIWLQYSPAGGPPSQPTSLSALYPPFPDLISKSLLNHKVATELDAILFVENLLPDNRVAPGQKAAPRTRETSLYISHGYLMLLDPSEILRRPPEHILQTIQKLVGDFQLGARLRSSMNPNFLANMLSRQTPENYVRWTRNLVLADPTTMEIMPMGALAELVLFATERAQFQCVPSVLNGAAPMQPLSPSDHRESTRRKSRAVSRQPSVNGGGAAVAHPAANTPAVVDPLLHHLPAMYAVLRRLLPTIDVMYGPTTTMAAGSQSTVEESRASILSVLSPKLGPTRHPSGAPTATPATPLPRVRLVVDGGEESPHQPSPPSRSSPPFQLPASPVAAGGGFDHAAFLDVLSMFLARLTSRTPCVRRAAAHGLHFWLCAESLPNSLDGVERRGACCEPARHFDQLGSEATPALPPATCWLKYFFLSFLHATDTPAATPAAPSFSLAFLTAGRLVVRKLCTALMCALEVENDPDTLFGYISFLHATATRFSYSPAIPPSKLFGLDLALRVCDVVLAREIVADKLLAPIAHTAEASAEVPAAEGAVAAAASSDEDSRSKKRKLGHSRSAASNGESSMVDAGSDALPMLDLDASAMPQLFALDPVRISASPSPAQALGAGYALVSIFSPSLAVVDDSQAYATGATRTASPSLSDDKLHRCTLYSGYALVVSVLSAAFAVVEYMQEDEKFIRRMLQREQKKADRMHMQGLTMQLSVPDSSPPTPLRATPQLKRSRSQMEEEDLDEAEEDLADESDPTAGVQPTEMKRRYSGANEDALMTEDPLNQSQTAESVDEDFVTLHRSWPTCAQPILAYVPLPLLHGIVSFLASPYALPPPTPSGEEGASQSMLQLAFEHYQHLLTLLLPAAEGPTGHAVSMLASESLPTLPIKAGASWMTDFSGIQWPMPSELQADHFLEQSTTPMLLLLAIEVCSPIQLLAALTRFGLADTLLERIFTKLDAWANYQVRLSQRQTPPATAATTTVQGGMTKSSSSTSLSLTPAMRELILQLPKILHYVRLYQSTLRVDRPEAGRDVSQPPGDIAQPGAALLAYLESLAPIPATVTRAVSPPAPSSDGLVSSIRLLLANAPDVSPSLRAFQRIYQLAQGAPGDFFQLVLAAVDGAHCDLSHLAPLVQLAVASLSADQLRLAHAFCSQLAVGLQALKGSSREKSAYIHHDMACADLEQWSEWTDQRAAQLQATHALA